MPGVWAFARLGVCAFRAWRPALARSFIPPLCFTPLLLLVGIALSSTQPNAGLAKWSAVILAFAAVGFAAFQVASFIANKSSTIDETFYLNCALQSVHDGHIDPRLPQSGVAPWGAMTANLPVAWIAGGSDIEHAWESRPEHPRLNRFARGGSALIVLSVLAAVVAIIIARRSSLLMGVSGGALLLTSPTFLAHGSLAATDALFALASLLALLAIAQFRQQKGLRWGAVAVLAMAAAFSTKYTGVYLGIAFAIGLCVDRLQAGVTWSEKGVGIARALLQSVGIGLLVFVVAWGMHGFQRVPMPKRSLERTPSILQPAPVHGLIYQAMHNQRGHNAYLMGRFSLKGWWYYYPVTLLAKSTPAELLLMALAVLAAFRIGRIDEHSKLLQTLGIGAVVLFALALRSQICIGQRYLLPLYPTAIVLGSCWLSRALPRHAGLVMGGLLLVQTASSAAMTPHQLAYFSPLVGGPLYGANYLIDSNLDWGQDLPELRRSLQRLGKQRVAYQYFGSAAPEFYGVQGAALASVTSEDLMEFDAVAVSQTFLQGGYSFGRDPFQRLRQCTPIATAGYSIAIYDLTDPRVLAAVEQAIQLGVPVPTQ